VQTFAYPIADPIIKCVAIPCVFSTTQTGKQIAKRETFTLGRALVVDEGTVGRN
jgi:hypothetical protein